MIPKKIHYIWVGDNPKPDLVLQCIESWKELLPEYEIIEWGNELANSMENQYLQEAFKYKKWAFVSDYLRLYVLYHYGGIYLDSDVRITSSLDPFLKNNFFTGYELYNNIASPITAVMGAKAHNIIIADLLKEYDDLQFFSEKNGYNLQTNTNRISLYFQEKFDIHPPYLPNTTTYLDEKSVIYPSGYFCTPNSQEPNYAIHLFNGSWVEGFSRKLKLKIQNYSFIRFKRENNNNEFLPLLPQEKILFKLQFSSNKIYAITKRAPNV